MCRFGLRFAVSGNTEKIVKFVKFLVIKVLVFKYKLTFQHIGNTKHTQIN